jgi:plastocyanin
MLIIITQHSIPFKAPAFQSVQLNIRLYKDLFALQLSFKMQVTMMSIISSIIFAGALAAPTATTPQAPSGVTTLTGVTHTVVAGLSGLHFDPDNVVAQIGDIVEWIYLPKNHSVAQSSFAQPCKPLAGNAGFFSGFNFATTEGLATDVFQFTVVDNEPVWYYCAQTDGNHCQMGMAGVINQNFNSPNTLANYIEVAAGTGVSIIPPFEQGGEQILNPNPLGGFKLKH